MSNDSSQSLLQRYPALVAMPMLLFFSTALLVVALNMPLMNVEKMVFWQNEYSVLTGILGLYKDGQFFLCAILFVFCVIFPIIKLLTLWLLWFVPCADARRQAILGWLGILGKWSMLDVFVVAILIVAVKLGPLAKVEPRAGVYVFSFAIMLSMAATTWIERLVTRRHR